MGKHSGPARAACQASTWRELATGGGGGIGEIGSGGGCSRTLHTVLYLPSPSTSGAVARPSRCAFGWRHQRFTIPATAVVIKTLHLPVNHPDMRNALWKVEALQKARQDSGEGGGGCTATVGFIDIPAFPLLFAHVDPHIHVVRYLDRWAEVAHKLHIAMECVAGGNPPRHFATLSRRSVVAGRPAPRRQPGAGLA